MSRPLDMFGNLIQVGDIIIKPHSLGRSPALGLAVVLTIKERESRSDKKQQYTMRIRTYVPNTYQPGWKLRKPGSFMFTSRCLVISPDALSEEIREALEPLAEEARNNNND